MAVKDVDISFRSTVNQDAIHSNTLSFIKLLGDESGNYNIEISSSARSPMEQAIVMYENCVKLGVESQRKLYLNAGDQVIRVFERYQGATRNEAINAMYNKIFDLGPSRVSKHCVDPSLMNVIDIPFSSIQHKGAFRRALGKYSPNPIECFLVESDNNCFHIELRLDNLGSFLRTANLSAF